MFNFHHLIYVILCLLGIWSPKRYVSDEVWNALIWVVNITELRDWEYTSFNKNDYIFPRVIDIIREELIESVDFPSIKDLERLPNIQVAQKNTCLAEVYINSLKEQREFAWNKDEVDRALSDTNKLYNTWSYIYGLKYPVINDYWTVFQKRRRLNEIKLIVGIKNYWEGRFPNPIPIKYLMEIP